MKKLWKRTFVLFRRHFLLWVPCSIAGILMTAFERLQKAGIHWLFGFFGTQRSVLGGVVPSSDLSHVQHQVMMIVYPIGTVKDYLEILLFVVALTITKNLVQMVVDAQRPDMIMAVQRVVPRCREVLQFSLRYMAVMVVFGGVLILASFVLTSQRFRELALSKAFLFVVGLIGECCLAWLLVPSAIRLLRPPGSYTVSARDRQTGTIFAVAASAVSFGLEFLVGKGESRLILDNQWEGYAIAVANSVIVNMPQILLVIALALLAIQTLNEGTSIAEVPEMNWGRQLSDWVRRTREWRGGSS
jgi:hypothetical protein